VSPADAFGLACPLCHTPLPATGDPTSLTCPQDGYTFRQIDGIWRFLLPERAAHLSQFMQEYEQVRKAEGWGGPDAAYYRALPFVDRNGRYADIWRIRAQSYRVLCQRLLPPETEPQRILDLGAGNGWLANRLAQAGHAVAAIDLMVNATDGLGTHRYYDAAYLPLQAEYDYLPLTQAQANLAIFNGSFQYATNYERTLREVLRVLRPQGRIVIMDSPLYRDGRSGQQMVQERQKSFVEQYGFRGNALPHENYLTYGRLAELADALSLRWQIIKPFYGWRWAIRPWLARLRRHREPASFYLIAGQRVQESCS
jgi:SAM-dependent methyltransferase